MNEKLGMAEQGLEDPRDAEVLPWTFKVSVLWMQLISVGCIEKRSKHAVLDFWRFNNPTVWPTRTKQTSRDVVVYSCSLWVPMEMY